ncbi:MAG: hypothetical protein Q4D26_00255 [Clostridia bacterium]|nr:hypothetical protein [Clostridia bacterium]
MKKRVGKIIIYFIIILILLTVVTFKCFITIDTYNKTGFTMTVSIETEESSKKWLEYYKLKDFENMKKLDYQYTKFFDFPGEDIICEYIFINTTVIYEGPAQKRNIYAVLCKDKTIKYIVDAIGTVENIEDRYNYDEPIKVSWLNCDVKETKDLELQNPQYNKIINLLKLLKLCHAKNNEYDFGKPHSEDKNVFYLEDQYYDFEEDNSFISNMIEDAIGGYLKEIIYKDSGFKYF